MHQCGDIKESVEKFKGQLTDDMNKISTCVLRSRKNVQDIKVNKRKLVEKVGATEEAISKLLDELKLFKIQSLNKMKTNEDEIEHRIVVMERFVRYCQEMKEKGTACDLARSIHNLRKRAGILAKVEDEKTCAQPNNFDLAFCSSFAEYANENNFIGRLFPNGIYYFL